MTKQTLEELRQTITYRPPTHRFTPTDGRQLINAVEYSGLNDKAFAEVVGLSSGPIISYWRQRIKKRLSWTEIQSRRERKRKIKLDTAAVETKPEAGAEAPPPPQRRRRAKPTLSTLSTTVKDQAPVTVRIIELTFNDGIGGLINKLITAAQ